LIYYFGDLSAYSSRMQVHEKYLWYENHDPERMQISLFPQIKCQRVSYHEKYNDKQQIKIIAHSAFSGFPTQMNDYI